MTLFFLFFLTIFFLIGSFALTALNSSFRRLHPRESEKLLNLKSLFFYKIFTLFSLEKYKFEGVFFTTLCAQTIARYGYAICAYLFIATTPLFEEVENNAFEIFWVIISFIALIFIGFFIGDFLPRIFGTKTPEKAISICTHIAAPYLLFALPISLIFLKFSKHFSNAIYFDHFQEPTTQARQEIIEIIQRAEMAPEISRHEKQLFESVLDFRKRIVREVMAPRIETFCLSADTTIREAAKLLESEGYSRTPIYKNSIDNITGILMYKDVMKKYMEYTENGNDPKYLDAPIETIAKPALYTPETKKISNLLQEFRKKQVHLAIVIDEYGGTEGIITIEDILEEIVGDIADEYDQEEELFKKQSDHSWIVDARLNIFDAEEQFHIEIPQDGEYDTIGGYVYHRAGTIPAKGFVIHHDTFEIEVINSNERAVEKVRIKKLDH